ncbi:MAG: isopentenyl-diphosphate delta-isomerase [Microgenomates group bacterium Gr01-1014_80]|nr:MAG: isopentenyl-diphosphate delta-isomerase [Microgenomates group bacterium Gr01-1014_80]
MTEEILEIVNSRGQIIGLATRVQCYQKGLLHKAVSIFIRNFKGEIFLQKRSSNKSSFPLHWDLSASEHLKLGESYINGAKRGLQEELGIVVNDLRLIRPVHRQKNKFIKAGEEIIENELVELYLGEYNGEVNLDPSEVANGRFCSQDEIQEMINKEKFTPWFLDEWKSEVVCDNIYK